MEFLFPGFLYALFALAIPIIIHLFNFRRYKRIVFTNVRFLKEVQEETKSQSRLKHILILCTRLLTITALVFAFAQPFIPAGNVEKNKDFSVVGIYVDNSFSMEGVGESGRLLDRSKFLTEEIINAHGENQRFVFLTNDFSGKHLSVVSAEDAKLFVEEIEVSNAFRSVNEVVKRFQSTLSASYTNAKLYLLTDLQQVNFEVEFSNYDSSISISIVPLQNQVSENVYIDSVWFADPIRKVNQAENLHVRIANSSEETVEDVSVNLYINEEKKSLSSVTLTGFQKQDVVLSYTLDKAGAVLGKVKIEDYPITYDDEFFFNYSIDTGAKILLIHGTDSIEPFLKLFDNDEFFALTTQEDGQVNYGEINEFQTVFLHGVQEFSSGLTTSLVDYVRKGGTLAMFPAKDIDEMSYANFCNQLSISAYGSSVVANQSIREITFDHPIFSNVFEKVPKNPNLPKVSNYFLLRSSGANTIISLGNDAPFLNYYKSDEGQVFQFSTPFFESSTNFLNHALLVPTLYQIALFSAPKTELSFLLNNQVYPIIDNEIEADAVYLLQHTQSGVELIPEVSSTGRNALIKTYQELKESGHYDLKNRNTDKVLTSLSLNYDRKESNLAYLTENELLEWFEKQGVENVSVLSNSSDKIVQELKQEADGRELWKYFIIAAIFFLLVELILLKFLPD